MKADWIEMCLRLSEDSGFYSGCRKILRGVVMKTDLESDLELSDAGYTKAKMSHLRRHYVHQESADAAKVLWEERLQKNKYGSVGFTCYGHFVKGGTSKRASKMGPCIQAVTLTALKKKKVAIDVFYRTTEFYKKFPADLVFLRDELLEGFEIPELEGVTLHFANVTIHPMYWVTIVPHLERPVHWLKSTKAKDTHFHNWLVKWTARYICDEYQRGIQKFSQAMRVRKDALERIQPRTLKSLQSYCRKNHPGYRGEG